VRARSLLGLIFLNFRAIDVTFDLVPGIDRLASLALKGSLFCYTRFRYEPQGRLTSSSFEALQARCALLWQHSRFLRVQALLPTSLPGLYQGTYIGLVLRRSASNFSPNLTVACLFCSLPNCESNRLTDDCLHKHSEVVLVLPSSGSESLFG
jgi:hypothetical protein